MNDAVVSEVLIALFAGMVGFAIMRRGTSRSVELVLWIGLIWVCVLGVTSTHDKQTRELTSAAAWGANWSGQCNLSAAWVPAVGIAAGSNHTLVLPEGGTPVLRLLNPAWKPNQFSATVQTLNRKSYALEFRDSLSPTNWTLLPGVPGNGALRVLTNSTAAAPRRFYRSRQW